MNENQTQTFRGATQQSPPYNFPSNRECSWCKKSANRSAGKWVTKATWVCNKCYKGLNEND